MPYLWTDFAGRGGPAPAVVGRPHRDRKKAKRRKRGR